MVVMLALLLGADTVIRYVTLRLIACHADFKKIYQSSHHLSDAQACACLLDVFNVCNNYAFPQPRISILKFSVQHLIQAMVNQNYLRFALLKRVFP